MDDKQQFGRRVRFVRERREMTQAALAKASGLDPSVVSSIEAGRRVPGLGNLKALARALMVSADYLLGLSERIGP